MAKQIPELRSIVGFRNIPMHGYAVVNHEIVWRTVQEDLPHLRTVLDALLGVEDGEAG